MISQAMAPALEAGAVPMNRAASGVASLLRDAGRLVASSRASFFISLVFSFRVTFFVSVNVFAFCKASTSNLFFQKQKQKKLTWW